MLEVFRKRNKTKTAKDLFKQYKENRFVAPALIDPESLMKFDQLAFSLLPDNYEALELFPAAPLEACSILAPVDQNNSIVTIRNTEVCSDSTNILALECAKRRNSLLSKNPKSIDKINLCSSHRLLRAQLFNEPGAYPHFRLFSLCTAGRALSSHSFEINSIIEHVTFYLVLLQSCVQFDIVLTNIRVLFIPIKPQAANWLNTKLIDKLKNLYKDIIFQTDTVPENTTSYYENIRFQIYASDKNKIEYLLIDGGFTDWTQQLSGNKNERLLISGLGSERLLTCFNHDHI